MIIRANKNQDLDFHLRRISEDILDLGNNGDLYISKEGEYNTILKYANILVGLFHDLGKTSTYFQNRLKNNINGKSNKVDIHEYHNWGYLFYKDVLSKFLKQKKIDIDKGILESICYSGSVAVLNHHFDLDNKSKIDDIEFLKEGESLYIDFNAKIRDEFKLKDYIKLLFNNNVINQDNIKYVFNKISSDTEYELIKELSLFISNYNFKISIFNNFGELNKNNFDIFGGLRNDGDNENNNFLFNSSLINKDLSLKLLNFIFLPNLIYIDKKISIELTSDDFVKYKESDNTLIEEYYTNNFPLEKSTGLNYLRGLFFKQIHSNINKEKKIHIIEAPAGIGKFLTLTSYSSKLLDEKLNKVIYIAPFVSILDQNSNVIKEDILNKKDDINNLQFSKINYLAKKRYSTYSTYNNIDNIENEKYSYLEKYMLKSLNSKYVFTTFVNIFNSLFGFKNVDYVQTLNLLNNSILIIDEIQDFNKENLYFLKFFLEQIVPNHNIKIILSSATLPKFIYDELKEEDYFFYNYYNNTNDIKLENEKYFNRIKLELLTESKIDILHDINDISYNINNETLYDLIDKKIRNNKRILFINHTIDASEKLGKKVLDKLGVLGDEGTIIEGNDNKKYIYYFLNNKSKNKFEKDIIIENVKNHDDNIILLLFSTQLIKAGVDIDMDICFSDFFNLFDITQIGGRVNRNNKRVNDNTLFLYALKNGEGYDFEKISGDNDSNSTGIFKKYIELNGLHNNINEQYLYNIELESFNRYISDNLNIKNYDLIFNMLDYEEISKKSKLINDNKDEITYIKDLNNFLFINNTEKDKLESYLTELLKTKDISNKEIEIKGKKYGLQSFLNTIKKYELDKYNLGEFYNGKSYKIFREFNDFII